MYDEYGMDGIKQNMSGNDMDAQDIFSQFFGGGGGRSRGPRRTENITRNYQVKLEDLYKGKNSKFRVTHKVICPACKGRGGSDGCEKSCSDCGGRGVRVRMLRRGNMIQQMQSPCSTCNGKGVVIDPTKQCKECHGSKVVPETKTIEVCLERGMKDGDKVVLPSAADEAPGMEAGDIIYVIHQARHPVFEREGPDLMMTMTVSVAEAMCGFTRYIRHLDGRVLEVTRPAGAVTEPDSFLVIHNEGMPLRGSVIEHGSLFIKIIVNFPLSLPISTVNELKKILEWPTQPTPVKDAEKVSVQIGEEESYGHSVREPEYNSNVGMNRNIDE